MLVRHLIPVIVLTAVAVHFGKAVKVRAAGVLDVKSKVVVKQHMNTIIDAISLELSSGAELPASQAAFQQFCNQRLRARSVAKNEQYKDPWGTPLRYQASKGRYWITSAGPDALFATGDDIKVTGTEGDY